MGNYLTSFCLLVALVAVGAGGCATEERVGYIIAEGLRDTDTQTRFQDTESGLQDTESGLQDTESGLQDTEEGFQDTESGLQDTDTSLQDTDTSLQDTDTSLQDTDSGTGGLFPMIFTFNEGDDGFSTYDEPGWTRNESTGTFDLDVTFTGSPEWRTLELYAGEGIWPGGVDWRGATSIEYRVRVEDSNGGYFRAFIQSIEQESVQSETWFWYASDSDLVPDDAWHIRTIDLTDSDAPLNLEEVTKIGLQIHAVEPVGISSADTDYPLPEHVSVQIDSIIVQGTNP